MTFSVPISHGIVRYRAVRTATVTCLTGSRRLIRLSSEYRALVFAIAGLRLSEMPVIGIRGLYGDDDRAGIVRAGWISNVRTLEAELPDKRVRQRHDDQLLFSGAVRQEDAQHRRHSGRNPCRRGIAARCVQDGRHGGAGCRPQLRTDYCVRHQISGTGRSISRGLAGKLATRGLHPPHPRNADLHARRYRYEDTGIAHQIDAANRPEKEIKKKRTIR